MARCTGKLMMSSPSKHCNRVISAGFSPYYCLVILLLTGWQAVYAADTLESVIKRMQPGTAVQINYQETRYMGLFADDWHSSGYLYAQAPDITVKQQLQPEIEIMAAIAEQLYYLKPSSNTLHQTQLDESDPMMASLGAFKAIITGNLNYLREYYQLQFNSTAQGWTLHMRAKDHAADSEALSIMLKGQAQQAAQEMQIILPDGDKSSYVLSQPQQGEHIRQQLDSILQSLKGQ